MIRFINSFGQPPAQSSDSHEFVVQQDSNVIVEEERRKIRSKAMRTFKKRQRETREHQQQGKQARDAQPFEIRCTPKPSDRGYHAGQVDCDATRTELIPFERQVSPQKFDSPSAYRIATAGAFMDGFFPSSIHRLDILAARCSQWRSPKSKTMEVALDAIGLLQMDSSSHNAQVRLEGQRRQLALVSHLQKDLLQTSPDFAVILAPALYLMLSEIYKPVSQGSSGWKTQVDGVMGLVTACGLELVESVFGRILFSTARMSGLMYAFVSRRAFVLGQDHWRKAIPVTDPGGIEALMHNAVCIPGLLQSVDRLCSGRLKDQETPEELLTTLSILEYRMSTWLSDHYSSLGYVKPPFTVRSAEEFAHVIPASQYRIDRCLRFDSFISASFHTFYWTCILLLRRSLLQTFDVFSENTPAQKQALLESTHDCADHLCQSMPYLIQIADGNVSLVGAVQLPLLVAKEWYEELSILNHARWCEELTQHVRNRVPGLNWDACIPFNFFTISCLAEWQPVA